MKRRIAITGLGLVSAAGESPSAAFDAWCKGRSHIALHAVGELPHQVHAPMALCADFDAAALLGKPRLATMDRVSQLSTVAAQSAWHNAGLQALSDEAKETCGVFWGTGGGGTHTTERSYRELFVKGRARISPLSVVLGMHNAAASHIALQLGLGGDCLTYSVACASSAMALGEALRRIQSGHMDVAVAGGAEASMPYGAIKAWESLQVMAKPGEDASTCCRPFHADRTGLVIGEGAAALVLEEWTHAQRRGATIYAELAGYGSSCDHTHLTTPDAAGQVRAIRQALRDAQVEPRDIRYVNAHGTATSEGDPVEIQALSTVLGDHAPRTPVSSTKSMHGHLLGAAGAIEALVTTLAVHRRTVPPTANLDHISQGCMGVDHVTQAARDEPGLNVALSNSFAFGGSNAVLVFRAAA